MTGMAQAQGCGTGWAALLLDMDGTLVDTEAPCQAALDSALRDCAIRLSPSLRRSLIGLSTRERVARLHATLGAGFNSAAFVARYYHHRDALLSRGVRRKPGATALLAAIEASGLPWGVVTSAGRDSAIVRLREAAIRPAVVVTRDDVARGKPAPDGYLLAASRLGAPPARCFAIEDSPHGVRAAASAGLHVAMVPDLLPPGPVEQALCFAVLPHLSAAVDLLPATGSRSDRCGGSRARGSMKGTGA